MPAFAVHPRWLPSELPSHHLGELRLAQGAHGEASELLERALTIARRNRDMQGVRYSQQTLAEAIHRAEARGLKLVTVDALGSEASCSLAGRAGWRLS